MPLPFISTPFSVASYLPPFAASRYRMWSLCPDSEKDTWGARGSGPLLAQGHVDLLERKPPVQ